jgi:hypothetical protein
VGNVAIIVESEVIDVTEEIHVPFAQRGRHRSITPMPGEGVAGRGGRWRRGDGERGTVEGAS